MALQTDSETFKASLTGVRTKVQFPKAVLHRLCHRHVSRSWVPVRCQLVATLLHAKMQHISIMYGVAASENREKP